MCCRTLALDCSVCLKNRQVSLYADDVCEDAWAKFDASTLWVKITPDNTAFLFPTDVK